MIECKNVSFSYYSNCEGCKGIQEGQTLKNVSCTIADGSFVLLCGTSGCGKTTLTILFNGLIPHYYEGELSGQILLDGKECKDLTLFDISEKDGSVFQNPRSQFFNIDPTSELAFGAENHGLPEQEIGSRVRRAAEQFHITGLLERSIFSLSGGEKQKIACGSAAVMGPEVFVFDEPTSGLDLFHMRQLADAMNRLAESRKRLQWTPMIRSLLYGAAIECFI